MCASAHSLDRISRQHVTHVPFAFARCCAASGRRRTDLVPERRHENRKRFGRLCRHEFQNRTTQTQGLPSHERQPERQRGHSRGERRTLSLHHRSAAGRHLQYRLASAAHRPLQSGRHCRECTRRGRITRGRRNPLRYPNEQTKRTHRQSQRTPHRGRAIDRPHGAAHLPRRSARAPRTERFRHVDPRRQRRPSGTTLHRHRSPIALERRRATLCTQRRHAPHRGGRQLAARQCGRRRRRRISRRTKSPLHTACPGRQPPDRNHPLRVEKQRARCVETLCRHPCTQSLRLGTFAPPPRERLSCAGTHTAHPAVL